MHGAMLLLLDMKEDKKGIITSQIGSHFEYCLLPFISVKTVTIEFNCINS